MFGALLPLLGIPGAYTMDIQELLRRKNRILNQWEQYYRQDQLESFPTHIQFPTGTRCNLRCRFCTEREGEKAKDYNYKDLSYADFFSVVRYDGWNAALNTASTIALYGWGEPLFNPDYERIFDYLSGHYPGLGIVISTNGTMFNQKWSEKIVAVDNSEVNFSINAANSQTYQNMSGINHFDRVVANIRGLTGLREKNPNKNPGVTASYVLTIENIRELLQFVDLCADLKVDSIIAQDSMILNEETRRISLTNEPDLAYEICTAAKEQAKRRRIQIGFVSFESHPEKYFPPSLDPADDPDHFKSLETAGKKESEESKINRAPSPYFSCTDCFDPWERFMVRADGEVFPCCQSQTYPELTLGSIHRQGFMDIWNGEAYRRMRRRINTDNPLPVCAICPKKTGSG